LDGVKVASGEA
jgi:uncharacterized phage infection (PIP) family protein YhgE